MMSKFEKKFGRYAIKNLTAYLIAGYAVGYILSIAAPNAYSLLTFNPYYILHGQIWRVITWVLTMPESLNIFTIIMLILYFQLGRELEAAWGTYRYNVYLFSGFLFTIAGAFILYFIMWMLVNTGVLSLESYMGTLAGSDVYAYCIGTMIGARVSTYYINMSIFLAYAATYPEQQLMLYFLIPIKIKWFGVIYGAYILFDIIQGFKSGAVVGIIIAVMIFISLLNFIIYFVMGRNGKRINPKQMKRRYEYRRNINSAAKPQYSNGARHKCAVCGRTELDDPTLTFRYCSKCTGNKEYCQEHLFTHIHQ